MLEKTLVLMIIYLGMILYDVPKLKQANRRERIIYGTLMISVIYLSLVFVMDLEWPTLDDFVHFIFGKPAQQIVDYLMSSSK
ncbi:hypothetical protein [Metabacillus arenae]|uniref:Uncharacterized protein n=1 Tax=Metabacillus arenae TaxID=2771434 RepID=A0A926NDT0_9BACI|nr:hypothetical protein [Metabacillus arenae]MBD1379391.1 hypothetical protein [Metabacillus arenae]